MTAIILMILKIIGILALILIGVCLLLLGTVLFVPIRYRVNAACQTEPGQVSAQARLSWLLHFLTVRIAYDNGLVCKVRLFGITVYDIAKKELYEERAARKQQKKERRQKAGKKAGNQAKEREAEKEQEQKRKTESRPLEKKQQDKQEQPERTGQGTQHRTPECQTVKVSEQEKEQKLEQKQDQEQDQKQDEKTEQAENSPVEPKKGFRERIVEFFRLLHRKLKNIQYTIRGFCDKIKQIVENIAYYKETLEREESKKAFLCCKKQLFQIWRNIRPGKLKITMEIGFDDPAATGQFVALYSMFYPWIYHTVTLEPDFENPVLKGTFFCRGRITVFVLLRAAWILYFDKNIRTFLRLWKKEEIEHG